MIQRRKNLRFPLEPRDAFVILANAAGNTLMATSRLSFVSRARNTSPIPSAPMEAVIS